MLTEGSDAGKAMFQVCSLTVLCWTLLKSLELHWGLFFQQAWVLILLALILESSPFPCACPAWFGYQARVSGAEIWV